MNKPLKPGQIVQIKKRCTLHGYLGGEKKQVYPGEILMILSCKQSRFTKRLFFDKIKAREWDVSVLYREQCCRFTATTNEINVHLELRQQNITNKVILYV